MANKIVSVLAKDKGKSNLVQKYLDVLTIEDIKTVNRWTSHADVSLDKLKRLAEKMRKVEPVEDLRVYRGIGMNLSYQEKMGIFEKKFIFHFLKKDFKEGTKFKYATPRPLSFTDNLQTAKAFGDTIVTTVFTKDNSFLRITEAFWEAANKIEASSLFQEVILLDVNQEIEYTIFKT